MKVQVLREAGWDEAMLGLSLSYNQDPKHMPSVAEKLLARGGSHIKYLESISVWLDITAPRYWWQQFDTYRVGVTKQSESTMHTLFDHPLTATDFEGGLPTPMLDRLNEYIRAGAWAVVKRLLPESFLQRRIVATNYGALRRMIEQRRYHKLAEWRLFCSSVRVQVKHPKYLEV